MGWTRNLTVREQSSSPVFDTRFASVDRPVIEETAIGFCKSLQIDDAVTFEFSDYVMYGKYASKRFWFKRLGNGAELQRMLPECQVSSEDGVTLINGAMRNPVDSEAHGYDSRSGQDMSYNDALNIDPGKTGTSVAMTPGDSIIKTVSRELGVDRPVITDSVLITFVSEIPRAGSFCPRYNANTEEVPANVADIDFSMLGTHPLLGDTPDIGSAPYNTLLDRPWLEHNTSWTSREIRALNNQIDPYGVYFATPLGEAAVLLNMGFTDEQKRDLLIQMVQYGLDIYSFASTGSVWLDNGGQNTGRKLPLLIAGRVLNDTSILEYADAAQHLIFHDDRQTFYVSQDDVDMTNSVDWEPDYRIASPVPYGTGDIGLAEWGVQHTRGPRYDVKNWDHPYRGQNGWVIFRHALAANLMNAESQWNHPAYFDYADRVYSVDESGNAGWLHSIWNAYKV